jgi:serine/threonine protein kinase/Tol biopolymer transport system component
MGEVFRARDTRLGRDVALKVLPPDVSFDSGRRTRFEQEARAAAALNHPNIVGLHDVGEENGVAYIVSELVAGETLASLLQDGPLPVRKLLDIAVQLADGMAAAHAARITHRDLKPANLIVTPEGRVKILDFGLAKQTAAATEATVTQSGIIMGTVHYMSPEQARGRTVDHRSDQFSFGLILYEMAAGRKAFDKPETVQTMSAVITEDPPPIEREIPAPLRWTIGRCLAKDPADRYESSGDLFRELRQIRDHLATKSTSQMTSAVAVAVPPAQRRIRWIFPIVGTAGLIGAFYLGRTLAPSRYPDQSAYSFTPFAFESGGQYTPVWSPDGKAVAYAGNPDGANAPLQVMVRYLDQPLPRRVTRMTHNATPIGWTPDGARILFQSSHEPAGVWSISAVGGEPESLHRTTSLAAISPDAKSVAVLQRGDDGVYAVWTASPPGSPLQKYPSDPLRTRSVYNMPRIRFSPDGRSILAIVFTDRRSDEAWVLPYPPDPARPPRRALPDLRSFSSLSFGWMPDSRRIVLGLVSAPGAPSQLWLADLASGAQTQLTSGTTSRADPAVAPAGDRIVFTEPLGDMDIVSVDLQRGVSGRLISTGRSESMPAWAAKARVMAYVTNRSGPLEIWLRDAGGDRPLVSPKDFPQGTTQWLAGPAVAPDGSRVAFNRIEYSGPVRLWNSSTAGGAPVRLTNDDSTAEFPGSWSSDGSWFAYSAIRNGSRDLMKVKTSGQAAPVLLKASCSGEVPEWSPSGEWIVMGDRLISSDAQTERELPKTGSPSLTFSRDGKLLYGIRHEVDAEILFSLDVASEAQKTIAKLAPEFRPMSDLRPAVRLSLSPEGNTLTYGVMTSRSNLWMLTGALKP